MQYGSTLLGMPPHASAKIATGSVASVMGALDSLLADLSALYIKAKNLHWHLSAPQYCVSDRPLEMRRLQVLTAAAGIAERAGRLGGMTSRCLDHIARMQRLLGDAAWLMLPHEMLAELHSDIVALAAYMHDIQAVCDDLARVGPDDGKMDEAEQQVWRIADAARRV
jgi:starvation-inducible DNA-binding protein